jgi:hypothetical protein
MDPQPFFWDSVSWGEKVLSSSSIHPSSVLMDPQPYFWDSGVWVGKVLARRGFRAKIVRSLPA